MSKLTIRTSSKREVIDITDDVQAVVAEDSRSVSVFVHHTTSAVTTADLDPGTDQDYLNAFEKLLPDTNYNHPHDPSHMPDHILAALIGPSLTVPLEDGRLQLGQWQRIVLLEFDGPRQRTISVIS